MRKPVRAQKKKAPQRALAARHWVIIIIVIGLGAAAIFYRDWILNVQLNNSDGFQIAIKEREAKQQNPDNLQNSISRFFAGIRSGSAPLEDELSPYVIELEKTPIPLTQVLSHLEQEVNSSNLEALPDNWKGSRDEHWFMTDETIKQRLEQIAVAENMTFIWWLQRDYIVKSPFSIDAHFVELVNEVAITVNDDYQDQVMPYICFPHRAVIIIERPPTIELPEACMSVESLHQKNAPIKREGLPNLQIKHQ